jgi:hypothetical protein
VHNCDVDPQHASLVYDFGFVQKDVRNQITNFKNFRCNLESSFVTKLTESCCRHCDDEGVANTESQI